MATPQPRRGEERLSSSFTAIPEMATDEEKKTPTTNDPAAMADDEGLSPGIAVQVASAAAPTTAQREMFAAKPLLGSRPEGSQHRGMRTIPDESEIIEICIPDVIAAIGGRTAVGTLYLTDYRLVLVCDGTRGVGSGDSSGGDGDGGDGGGDSAPHADRSSPLPPGGDASAAGHGAAAGTAACDDGVGTGMRLRTGVDLSFCVPLGLILEAALADGQKRHVAHRVDPVDSDTTSARLAALFRKVPRPGGQNTGGKSVLHMTIETRDFRSFGLLFTAATDEACRSIHGLARSLQDRLAFIIANWTDTPVALTYGRGGDAEDWYM